MASFINSLLGRVERRGRSRRGGRRHYMNSNWDTSSEASDTDVSLTDDEIVSPAKHVSSSRLDVPVPRRARKRASSANSAVERDSESTEPAKSPYEQLWEDADKEFREKHKDVAKHYDIVQKKISNKKQDDREKSRPKKHDGFHSTLIQTRVFLNRSRKGRGPQVREKMSKFLTVLTQLTASLTPISGLDPVIAQHAWSAFCVVLTLCLNLTKKVQELLNDIEKVSDILRFYSALEDRYSNTISSNIHKQLFSRTKTLFTTILRFQALAAYRLDQHIVKRGVKEAFSLDEWPVLMKEIKEGDNACQQTLIQESHMITMDLIATLREDIQKLQGWERRVLDWLSETPTASHHNEVYGKSELFRDRGSWFVKIINEWIKSQTTQSTYWLHGIYGMGKTFLISRVIDSIEDQIQSSADRQLAYFYFSEEKGGNTPESAMRSLLAQLAITPDGSIAPSICALYAPSELEPPPKLSLNQCQQEMSILVEAQSQTIIVIDAIDECTEPGKFLRALKNVLPKRKKSVRIVVSSKEGLEPEISSVFRSYSATKLDATTNEIDIQNYVEIQVKKRDSRGLGRRLLDEHCDTCAKPRVKGTCTDCQDRAHLEDKLVKLLTKKCYGMFTWVELQLGLFFPPRGPGITRPDLEEGIQRLGSMKGEPKLYKVYEQIMQRNTNGIEAQRLAQRVYKWLLHSKLPLSRKALAEAVSINPDGSRVRTVDIFGLCSNFIDVSNDQVCLAHSTIRDYLEQVTDQKRAKVYSKIESHKEIAMACLACLKMSPMVHISSEMFNSTDWGFREYATVFWPTHLSQVPKIHENETLRDLCNDFFFRRQSSTSFKPWAEAWLKAIREEKPKEGASSQGTKKPEAQFGTRFQNASSLIQSMLSSPQDPFFAACMFGLQDVCSKSEYSAKEKSQKRNINDNLGVFLAIESQRLDALDMLVRAKVDVINTWQMGNNTLHWASMYGATAMIEFLVDQRADITSVNDDGATALHLAAASDVHPMAKILVLSDKGLDPNRPDAKGATTVHYAVKGPRVSRKLIRKLRDLAMDPTAKDASQNTALHYAVQNPDIESQVIEDLLDVVDINSINQAGKTALAYLVAANPIASTEHIQIFLDRQPNLSISDNEGTVLHQAVKNTKFSVSLVKRLISKDAINKPGQKRRTALHCAILPCQETSASSSTLSRTKSIVKKLLETGAQCDIPDEEGKTVLHYVARGPIWPSGLMQLLLDNNADAKAVNHLEETALHVALRHNKSNTKGGSLKKLIDATTDLSLVDAAGETVLHRGIRNLDITREILSHLLKGNVDVEAKDCTGSTAMHYAAESRSPDTLQILLDKRANPNALDAHEATALHRAAGRKTSSEASMIANLVKRGLNVNARDKSKRTPLHSASFSGDINAVRALLERHSADALAVDENKNTILHSAVSNPKRAWEITKYLLKREVAIDARNRQQETALHLAARKSSANVVRKLLDDGADCLAKTQNDETPLHYAAQRSKGSKDIIEMLLKANKDIREMKNTSGETALHLAIQCRQSNEGYTTLLQNRASAKAKNNEGVKAINLVSSDGKSALHHAAAENWVQAVEVLLKYNPELNMKDKKKWTPLCHAANHGHDAILSKLSEAGASVKSKTSDLSTPLHLAAANGHHECVQFLLIKRAKVDEKDNYSRTPLRRAMTANHEQVARLLIQHGANCNAKNSHSRTLLHRAASRGYPSMVRLLLENGADLEVESDDRSTPLDQAIKHKDVVTIGILLDHGAKYSLPAGIDQGEEVPTGDEPKARFARRDKLIASLLSK